MSEQIVCDHEWEISAWSLLPKIGWGEKARQVHPMVPEYICLKCSARKPIPQKELDAMAEAANHCSECGKPYVEPEPRGFVPGNKSRPGEGPQHHTMRMIHEEVQDSEGPPPESSGQGKEPPALTMELLDECIKEVKDNPTELTYYLPEYFKQFQKPSKPSLPEEPPEEQPTEKEPNDEYFICFENEGRVDNIRFHHCSNCYPLVYFPIYLAKIGGEGVSKLCPNCGEIVGGMTRKIWDNDYSMIRHRIPMKHINDITERSAPPPSESSRQGKELREIIKKQLEYYKHLSDTHGFSDGTQGVRERERVAVLEWLLDQEPPEQEKERIFQCYLHNPENDRCKGLEEKAICPYSLSRQSVYVVKPYSCGWCLSMSLEEPPEQTEGKEGEE